MTRVLFAGLFHETHTFLPEKTPLSSWEVLKGEDMFRREGDGSNFDGFLSRAKAHGWTVLPTADYQAMPSGTVEHAVFEAFWRDVERAMAKLEGTPIDAVFLLLHGAMVTDEEVDPEGELLERLRPLLPKGTPIFGVFDLHANFTRRIIDRSDCLVAYRENPHVDAREATMRAADLLDRCLKTKKIPKQYWRRPPLMWPPTGLGTADTPMKDLEAMARKIEAEVPGVWVANVIAGFAFADAPEVGVSFSIVSDGDPKAVEAALDRLEAEAIRLRKAGTPRDRSVDEVLKSILPVKEGPVLLVEPSDNIGGGTTGDGTGILRALLRHKVRESAVIIADPESVAALAGVTVGGKAKLAIGGKRNPFDEGPVELSVTLISKSDGRFTLEDPKSHLAAFGQTIEMGPSAVVEHEGVQILLTSKKIPPWDLGQLRSQGIEPTKLKVIGVKAAVAHRAAYNPITKASYTVETPGPGMSDLTKFPYRKVKRPLYPLDEIAS
ncbi:MAG: M81 family metallopeptidase [Alphaproteobacteria bacterium]|nr:M81 family metallopeptidase [Alphaproteobacteria bacterium]